MTRKNPHWGSTLDDFLREEGVRNAPRDQEDSRAVASQPTRKRTTKGRLARPVEDLDAGTLKAIANASVPAAHDDLDALIDDWTP
jgi:hypothetical protein